MNSTDYKSLPQAQQYHEKRFSRGLQIVSEDELTLVRKWLAFASQAKQATYLDLGTGTGRVIKELLKKRPKLIHALDRSEAMLAYLKKIYRKKINDGIIQTIVGESDNIPLPAKSVEVVTSLHLFKHLSHTEPTLQEVNRILKKGGFLIFDILNKNSIIRFNLGSCYMLSKSEIISKLERYGFTVLELFELHTFGETIYNLPGSNFIHSIDKFITNMKLGFGTKFFILAKKYD